jgi:hypothetical protein
LKIAPRSRLLLRGRVFQSWLVVAYYFSEPYGMRGKRRAFPQKSPARQGMKGDTPMSKSLRYTFLIHAVVAVLFGAPLLVMPGQFLGWFGWAPVDPILSRVLGAALLALAWSSYRGWQAKDRAQVSVLLEMEAVYTVLGAIGVLRHLVIANYPWYVWLLFVVLALFAIAWLYFLLRK